MLRRLSGSWLLLILFFQFSSAQSGLNCDGNRYLNEVFDSVKVTTQQYGKNISLVGDSLALYMDIYEPVDDPAAKRPAMTLALGGAYKSGVPTQKADLGRRLAQHGYAAA